jgi:hypothetical protein
MGSTIDDMYYVEVISDMRPRGLAVDTKVNSKSLGGCAAIQPQALPGA